MNERTDVELAKISDQNLRDFVRSDATENACVIVELDAPEPVVEFSRERGRHGSAVPLSATKSNRTMMDEERARKEVSWLLNSLNLRSKYLKSGRVFIVTADPSQLRRIAELKSVRSIIPNREVKY